MNAPLSVVLFSGTEDKLHAAATLAAGAAAMGRPVNVLLQFWGLEAFASDKIDQDHGLAFDARRPVAPSSAATGDSNARPRLPWAETLRMAKELGEVKIRACSASLDYLHLEATDLDPLVDGACGVAAFFADAEDGPITFI
jgi:peroxiredoxin family protein